MRKCNVKSCTIAQDFWKDANHRGGRRCTLQGSLVRRRSDLNLLVDDWGTTMSTSPPPPQRDARTDAYQVCSTHVKAGSAEESVLAAMAHVNGAGVLDAGAGNALVGSMAWWIQYHASDTPRRIVCHHSSTAHTDLD